MEETRAKERWQLLQSLRSTVEGLLTNGVSNVWNVYGGLNRLHNIMERIFKHGCRVFDTSGEPDCWIFIQGLNWLQPSLASSPTIRDCDEYHDNLPNRIISHKYLLWLYKSLEDHSLSQKLSWLLSDKEYLLSCLEPWAFLCQENLSEATLVCLRAVEKNQPALLTEIDPSLFLPNWSSKDSPKRAHRRSSSFPVNLRPRSQLEQQQSLDETKGTEPRVEEKPRIEIATNQRAINEELTNNAGDAVSLKTWSSFPDQLNGDKATASAVETETSGGKRMTGASSLSEHVAQSIELSDVIKVDYPETKAINASTLTTAEKNCSPAKSKYHNASRKSKKSRSRDQRSNGNGSSDTLNFEDSVAKSAKSQPLKPTMNSDHGTTESVTIVENNSKHGRETRRKGSCLAGSAPEFSSGGSWSTEVEGQRDVRTPKKSFIEEGGNSVLPMATGYFPRPKEGQSLTSFLSSGQFARTNAELDRENAHFSISEAMIAAIEQIKCNRELRSADETVDESDEEINSLKQRIRLRRRQRQEERRKVWTRDLLSDGKTDTTTTDQSISPLSTSPGTPSNDSISTDDVDDYEIDDTRSLSQQLKNSGLSVSMASLYSEADLYKSSPKHGLESNLTDSYMSAEGVALSLISRFSEKHLPRASELKWLVSERDAPQRLLPLPKSWPVNPDEVESSDGSMVPLRGTIEWAPPRPQIIFTAHPAPVRRILIAKQNYRCAGCGMRVAVKYASKYRYCEYLGRYFCTGCHTNQVASIPGKILSKWDFNRYPVSNFSYRLLDQMSVDPLFRVNDLNPSLYRRIKQLNRTRLLRTQLFYLKDFLFTCRFATHTQEALRRQGSHMISDQHIYSIEDFLRVKNGTLSLELNNLVQECCKHVAECILCQARAFVCEFCNSSEVIYPWELSKVTRCESCGACYHLRCVNPNHNSKRLDCKRCTRLKERRMCNEKEVNNVKVAIDER
ncbi:run domain Beclin-1-interacting and cysteine-rich domain-containing protein [Copidosoma floridanum]|uniref:run domain Beclin-1-interacting and cysteine-rich domain-containing protein n=1 Tax=Copidosoma floridanum TaxID=29053 RepID=UPI0006C98371|nr:run domain Beclin-1-interacting and cysteine-rich domain-containing protein [Copidosoma floridanum]